MDRWIVGSSRVPFVLIKSIAKIFACVDVCGVCVCVPACLCLSFLEKGFKSFNATVFIIVSYSVRRLQSDLFDLTPVHKIHPNNQVYI